MANIADVTVKKADGTTNVVFKAVTRAAGDKSPARFAQVTGFPVAADRPSIAISSRSVSGTTGGVRGLTIDGIFPIVLSNGEKRHVTLKGAQVLVPLDAPTADVTEGVHQLLNVAASAAVKDWCIEGNAPQ